MRARFIAEGRALRRVSSDHVIRAYDIGETDRQQPYMVLEYADRGTLADRIKGSRAQGWRPERRDVLAVVGPLSAAVEAVHRANLVHRDLSPSNILLCSGGGDLPVPGSRLVERDERLVDPVATKSALTGHAMPEPLADALVKSLATAPEDRHHDVAAWRCDVEAALDGSSYPAAGSDASARPRRAVWTSLGVLAGAAIASVTAIVLAGDPDYQEVTVLDDGRFVAADVAGEIRLAMTGPAEVVVGETAEFTVEVAGLDEWAWILPNGEVRATTNAIQLRPRSAGTIELHLIARSAGGEDLAVSHELAVRGS